MSQLARVFQCLILFAGNLHDYHTVRIINIVLHLTTINSPLLSCICVHASVCANLFMRSRVFILSHQCVCVCVWGVFINLLNAIPLHFVSAVVVLVVAIHAFTSTRTHTHTRTN